MAQVTFYIDDEINKKASRAAKAAGLSKSKWIVNLIEKEVDNKWPEWLRNGEPWTDFPDIEEIRSWFGPDAPRVKLD